MKRKYKTKEERLAVRRLRKNFFLETWKKEFDERNREKVSKQTYPRS